MKRWMKRVSAVLQTLGFSASKVQEGLTAEEWKDVCDVYSKTYGTTFSADKEANEDESPMAQLSADDIASIASLLGVKKDEVPADATEAARQAAAVAAQKAEAEAAAKAEAEKLAKEKEVDEPTDKVRAQAPLALNARHSATHLFGVEHDFYSRKKWYNNLMASADHRFVEIHDAERRVFDADFKAQAQMLRERLEEHRANGTFDRLDFNAIANGTLDLTGPTNTAYPSSVTGTDVLLGEYVTRRTDLILAYFKSLPSVKNLFPVRSNVQNREVSVTGIVGELSQGYRKGRIFKGSMEFDADLYKVDDLMFKFNFEDLVELEKQYIGYLNKDHSAIIKWTFIEWVMVHYGEQLIKEQNERNVIGTRAPQQNVVSNPSNLAADGVIAAVLRAIRERRIYPFENIGTYDADTMLDTVEAFVDAVQEAAGSYASELKIYLNERHKRWYIRAYRQKYGQDADFTGSHATLADLDPSLIIWVPNMRLTDYYMLAAKPGNIELLEDKPGEMLAFEFTPEFEGVCVKSRWKEGAHVEQAGKAFASRAAMIADDRAHQFVYVNAPMSTANNVKNTLYIATDTTTGFDASAIFNVADKDRAVVIIAGADGAKVKVSAAKTYVAASTGDQIVLYPELADNNGVTAATGAPLVLEAKGFTLAE